MTDQPVPDYLAALDDDDDDDDDPARIYIETDNEARVCGVWREEEYLRTWQTRRGCWHWLWALLIAIGIWLPFLVIFTLQQWGA